MSNSNGSLGKAGMIIGIIATVFAFLPMLSVWFWFLSSWMVPVLVVVGGILAGIGMAKKQDNGFAGVLANVVAVALYIIVWACWFRI